MTSKIFKVFLIGGWLFSFSDGYSGTSKWTKLIQRKTPQHSIQDQQMKVFSEQAPFIEDLSEFFQRLPSFYLEKETFQNIYSLMSPQLIGVLGLEKAKNQIEKKFRDRGFEGESFRLTRAAFELIGILTLSFKLPSHSLFDQEVPRMIHTALMSLRMEMPIDISRSKISIDPVAYQRIQALADVVIEALPSEMTHQYEAQIEELFLKNPIEIAESRHQFFQATDKKEELNKAIEEVKKAVEEKKLKKQRFISAAFLASFMLGVTGGFYHSSSEAFIAAACVFVAACTVPIVTLMYPQVREAEVMSSPEVKKAKFKAWQASIEERRSAQDHAMQVIAYHFYREFRFRMRQINAN